MTAADLDALEALEQAATPGPWGVQGNSSGGMTLTRGPGTDAPRRERHIQSHLQIVPAEDAALIAAARNSLPELLRLARRAERLEAALTACVAAIVSLNGVPIEFSTGEVLRQAMRLSRAALAEETKCRIG